MAKEPVGAIDLREINWLGVVVTAILGHLQLISNSSSNSNSNSNPYGNGHGHGHGCLQVEARIVSVCLTISLVGITASMPLDGFSKLFRISIFHVVLACAMLLSSSLPTTLFWLPYLSCIRPFFHLTPASFQLRFLRFAEKLWNEEATDGAATSVPSGPSSPSQVNLDMDTVSGEEVIAEACTPSPSISIAIQLERVSEATCTRSEVHF